MENFNTKNYEAPGGDQLVINGELVITPSGKLTADSRQFVIPPATGSQDSARINDILIALRAIGLVTSDGLAHAESSGLLRQDLTFQICHSTLSHELIEGELHVPVEGGISGAQIIEAFFDGRWMPRGAGWDIEDDLSGFRVSLPHDSVIRSRYLSAQPIWDFRWYM